ARGVNDTVVENVSVFGTKVDAGVIGDQDLSEGAPCSANPKGCSITARNLLSIGNAGRGMQVDTGILKSWSLVSSNLWGNNGGNDDPSRSCSGVHTRLHVNTAGCRFPAGY